MTPRSTKSNGTSGQSIIFKSLNAVAAKVCIPSSYCPAKHDGRLFDGLRGLALHWYQRRILQSFLAYLHSQHGRGKTYPEDLITGAGMKAVSISLWVKLRYSFKALKNPKSKGQGSRDLSDFCKGALLWLCGGTGMGVLLFTFGDGLNAITQL